jgi:hypothetical protein
VKEITARGWKKDGNQEKWKEVIDRERKRFCQKQKGWEEIDIYNSSSICFYRSKQSVIVKTQS